MPKQLASLPDVSNEVSCMHQPIYAKRQTDFVLQKMMGLFDIRTAAQYSSATVTVC